MAYDAAVERERMANFKGTTVGEVIELIVEQFPDYNPLVIPEFHAARDTFEFTVFIRIKDTRIRLDVEVPEIKYEIKTEKYYTFGTEPLTEANKAEIRRQLLDGMCFFLERYVF